MFSRHPLLGPNTLGRLGAGVLIILTMAACTAQPVVPAPTQPPPGPAVDLAATQAALNVASTQVAGAQATLTAQAQAQAAAATGTAQAAEVAAGATTQAATAQVGAATQAAQDQATSATQTALMAVASAQAATATALASASAALATANGTATAPASTAPPLSRTPTRTPFPRSNVACVALDSGLAPIANMAAAQGLDLGCPTAPASPVQGAVQEYWANVKDPNPRAHLRSLMIWRGDTREIYVIQGADTNASKGALMVYADTYQDGSPDLQPACANMQAPGGYQMPVRGFGKVWCNNNLGAVVGWPNRNEVQARLLMQPTRNGVLLQVSAPDAGLGYLAALDYGLARAVTSMIQP
jgi:hypothetical protein